MQLRQSKRTMRVGEHIEVLECCDISKASDYRYYIPDGVREVCSCSLAEGLTYFSSSFG